MFNSLFLLNSILLGVGLAMDAFSLCLANGLNYPHMNRKNMAAVSGTMAFFQFLMPLIGWFFVHTMLNIFKDWQGYIPVAALVILSYLGVKMIYEGINHSNENTISVGITFSILIIQGIATSVDALSVGTTISNYEFASTVICCLIIAVTTFLMCSAGIRIGKKWGNHMSKKSQIIGGVILIAIGMEIFLKSFL